MNFVPQKNSSIEQSIRVYVQERERMSENIMEAWKKQYHEMGVVHVNKRLISQTD
jgi:hypothetical protein